MFWCCYNDGREGHPRHSWLHCRFELKGLQSAEARFLRDACARDHIFVRFDLTARTAADGPTTIVLQEHWSETDPTTARFTECLGRCIDGHAQRWTRGEIKARIAATWARLPTTYADGGVESDGRFEQRQASQPCPDGLNNCVTFARHAFHLLSCREGGALLAGSTVTQRQVQ